MSPFATAMSFQAHGYSIIPILVDGSKRPAVRWKPFMDRQASERELRLWFGRERPYGLGIVTGPVSGNLEVVDLDAPDHVESFEQLVQALAPSVLSKLTVVQTPRAGGRGRQYWYRHQDTAQGGVVLAATADGKVLIETRGQGNYVVAAGSPPQVHSENLPYERIGGPKFSEIQTLTAEERQSLHAVAARFDCRQRESTPRSGAAPAARTATTQKRPGDEFNAVASWAEILEPQGWQQVEQHDHLTYWRRPDKEEPGHSATTGLISEQGNDLLHVFSSNAPPFTADASYTKFEAHALLNCGGDRSRAALELAEAGYGNTARSHGLAAAVGDKATEPLNYPPPLDDAALYGLAGEIVRTITPHSEADPVAVLLQFLAAFGNCVGRGPHFRAESDRHYLKLFVVLVGQSSKGRKGTSWGHICRLFRLADPQWTAEHIASGLSSGEGLIWAVRDETRQLKRIKQDGVFSYQEVVTDAGVADKRLLCLEPEFASLLKVMSREGNTLSPIVRSAWDEGNLRSLTKNSPVKATHTHISLVGHITASELGHYLTTTEASNGFGNRFLWVCVRRSKLLPEGGQLTKALLQPLADKISEAIQAARIIAEIQRDETTAELWQAIYGELTQGRPGLYGALTGRAEAQVMRLATIYAALDGSAWIRQPHLEAATAIWEYCEASVRFVFGSSTGNELADKIYAAVRASASGLTTTEISDRFQRNVDGNKLKEALGLLERAGLLQRDQRQTRGRPVTVWRATPDTNETSQAE